MNLAVPEDGLDYSSRILPPSLGIDDDLIVERPVPLRLILREPFELDAELLWPPTAQLVVSFAPRLAFHRTPRAMPCTVA